MDLHPAQTSLGSAQNSVLLTKLWQQRWSGILTLTEGGMTSWITLSDGGPVCDEDIRLVNRALRSGGSLKTNAWTVEGTGDRQAMAWLLMRSNPIQRPEFAAQNILRRVVVSRDALRLPLSSSTRRLLEAANGRTRLDILARRLQIGLQDIGAELYALYRLNLLTFVTPSARPG